MRISLLAWTLAGTLGQVRPLLRGVAIDAAVRILRRKPLVIVIVRDQHDIRARVVQQPPEVAHLHAVAV